MEAPEAHPRRTVSGVAHSVRNIVGFWRGVVAGDYVVVHEHGKGGTRRLAVLKHILRRSV